MIGKRSRGAKRKETLSSTNDIIFYEGGKIMPRRGIRYTATVMGGRKLKDGSVVIKLGVAQGNSVLTQPVKEMKIKTRRN